MDLGHVFEYVNYTTNKDALGEPVGADNFNLLLIAANDSYYNTKYSEVIEIAGASGNDIGVKLFNNTPLFRFLKVKSYDFGNTFPTLAPLPTDLGHTLGGTMYYNNTWRPGKLLDIESFNNRRYNIMSPSVKRKPIFIEKPGGYQFVPHNTRKARVDYLRTSIEPFFDYCVGLDDDKIYFMEVGSKLLSGTPDEVINLYGANDVLIATNVAHLSSSDIPYFSKTVELDWDQEDVTKIADIIIAIASVRSREFNVAQAASQSSQS
jgi:hypothetical protein